MEHLESLKISLPFLFFFYDRVEIVAGADGSFQSLSCEDLIILGQDLALTLAEFKEVLDDEDGKWERLTLRLTAELLKRKINLDPFFNQVYIYIYIYIFICVCIYVYIYIYLYIYMYICIYIYIYKYVYIHTCSTHIYIHINTCI
jgi:hypothetical protein